MKKVLVLAITILIAGLIVACQTVTDSPVVISKIYTSSDQENNVIELYNPSDASVDLSTHTIRFYTNGSREVSQSISLTGTIDANAYYVIGSKDHDNASVKALFDYVYETGPLPYNGNDAMELAVSNNAIDLVGDIGLDFMYSYNVTLIRLGEKDSYENTQTYNAFNFIAYLPDQYQYLKNDTHEIKTLEQLYSGPRLETRYLEELPYVSTTNSTTGGGGAVETTVQSIADGDTAFFRSQGGFAGGSVRYFYLNTPEVNGSNVSAEPWGYVASKYNKQYLLNEEAGKVIHVQSIPGYSLTEGYGRNLGLVWVNGHLSQFMIVAEGLSEDVSLTYQSYDLLLSYKNVPYLTFMRFAENRAKVNGWATKGYPSNPNGEKSPDWNYSANGGVGALATTTPNWEPKLPIPWK